MILASVITMFDAYMVFYTFLKKIFFNVYLFLRETETEHEWIRGRERGRHRI